MRHVRSLAQYPDERDSQGAIPAQIRYAISRLQPARQIKLYNSGSFFDPHAIPFDDYAGIADAVSQFDRVIVESHPALIGEKCFLFRDLLKGRLEVAMGLETVQPEVLRRLNKRMTVQQFQAAAGKLRDNGIDLRAFILVKPPFTSEADALPWAKRSTEAAFDFGASVVSLIPTRSGNGAMGRSGQTRRVRTASYGNHRRGGPARNYAPARTRFC